MSLCVRCLEVTMRNLTIFVSVLAFCSFLIPGDEAQAYTGIKNDWLAQYPDVCPDLVAIANDCSLCHGGGFSLNPYGSDLADASLDFAAIEDTDSDLDGRTNGEEILLDCKAPGDPASVPVDQATWSALKALFE